MKQLNVLAISAAVAGALFSGVAAADVTGNLGATSNYMWRGTTQTAGDASISGGIDYSHESGLYAGIWTANTSFGSPETDYYIGFGGEAGDFSYDISVVDYTYTQTDDLDWIEVNLGGGIADFSFNLGLTNDVFGTDTDATYIEAAYDIALNDKTSLTLHVGSYDFDDEAAAGFESYVDYSATISSGDWSFMLSDTDLDSDAFTDGDLVFVVSWGMEVDL